VLLPDPPPDHPEFFLQHKLLFHHQHFLHDGDDHHVALVARSRRRPVHCPVDRHPFDLHLLAPHRLVYAFLPLAHPLGDAHPAGLNPARPHLRGLFR
jgi:hypothetical protein